MDDDWDDDWGISMDFPPFDEIPGQFICGSLKLTFWESKTDTLSGWVTG